MTDSGRGEEWRDAPGFEGLYQVSNYGRVKSLPRMVRRGQRTLLKPEIIMTPVADKDGYPRVVFRVDGRHYTRKVHRLVCLAFNGPGNPLHTVVHHIDEDRANARAENLRWVSAGENLAIRHRSKPVSGSRNPQSRLTEEAVREIRGSGERASTLAGRFGVSAYAIYDVLRRRRWGHVQ